LAADLAGAAPNFAFIAPNQCHDGHGLKICPDAGQLTRDYDAFVETTVGLIRASPNWTANSAIVLTFDEGKSAAGRRRPGIATAFGVTVTPSHSASSPCAA
jgi:hypothetical protein